MRKLVTMLGLATMVATLAFTPVVAEDTSLPPNPAARYIPRAAGTEEKVSFLFGPYTVPPGQDINRITLDVPMKNGYYTAVAPKLLDPLTGAEPINQHAHIHHAHWLRVTNDPKEEPYNIGVEQYSQGLHLSWVFGTGEERTQGSLNDRGAVDGIDYGIYIKGEQPQALIYMIHNKTAQPLTLYVSLNVQFVHGTYQEIKDATDCGPLFTPSASLTCRAGADFHELTGKLWGSTFDVPRGLYGNDTQGNEHKNFYWHPRDIPAGFTGTGGARRGSDAYGRYYVAPWDGTMIAGAGHLHPLGKETVLVNLGKDGACKNIDVDNDGFPGTTIYRSEKIERVSVNLQSEDYQISATAAGFRAPVHKGDWISQFGIYRNDENASYEAMSFAGMFVDQRQVPLAPTGCDVASYGSRIHGQAPGADLNADGKIDSVFNTQPNHAWSFAEPDPLCGIQFGYGPCERSDDTAALQGKGVETPLVHIAAFVNLPGDRSVFGALGMPPKVRVGGSLRFINEDTAAVVRHTITSCAWPCNGSYVGNYPLPDGVFDSGKLGNVDPIDGAGPNDPPEAFWDLKPANVGLGVGLYSYFCRIHPWMRGTFEVIA